MLCEWRLRRTRSILGSQVVQSLPSRENSEYLGRPSTSGSEGAKCRFGTSTPFLRSQNARPFFLTRRPERDMRSRRPSAEERATMSYEAKHWALSQTVSGGSAPKVILFFLADWVIGDDQKECWPSVERLVFETGMNRKTIINPKTNYFIKIIKRTSLFSTTSRRTSNHHGL